MRIKRIIRLFFFSVCLLAPLPAPVFGNPMKFEFVMNLGVQFSGMVRDKDGFFWIATSNGLKRYDGLELKTWRKGKDFLSEDFIRAIRNTDEALWLLTNTRGLNRFDKNTGKFKHYIHDPHNEQSLRGAGGFALWVDKEGFVWIGTENGVLSRLNPKTDRFIHYRHDPHNHNSLPKGMITTIYQDSSGTFWIGSEGGGLTRFDSGTETFTRYQHDPDDPDSLSGNRVNVVLEDDNDILWVGTGASGLNRFDKRTGKFIRYQHDPDDPASISHNSVMSLCMDKSPYLWVGTIHGGLNRFNKQTGLFQRFLNDPKAPDANLTKVIQQIYIDPSDILWVFSRPGAILKSDRKTKGFSLYRHDPEQPGSISSNTILPIYEDKEGTVWIGTGNGGLNKYIKENDSFISFGFDPENPHSLPAPGVFAIAEDGNGNLWVAASDASKGTLSIFDRETNRFIKHYEHDPDNPDGIINNRFVLDICPDRFNPDILWLAVAFGGLEKFDIQKEIFTHYPGHPDDPTKLAGSYIDIYQDEKGILWLGGNYGLDRFDPVSGNVTRYRHIPSDPNSLIENNVSVIYEDRAGFLWLGTAGGLSKFNRKTGVFTNFTSKEGLPDNNILGILEDHKGNLWMSSGGGIIKFDPARKTFKLYTKADGLQGDAFYWFSHCLTQNGDMWFAGFGGANRFHPDNIKDNPHIPNMVLTSVKQGGEEVFFGKMPPRLKEIKLPWRSNFFEFEVAALEFTKPGKNRYMYRLDGIDDSWYLAGTRRFGKYTNLPGGVYHLKIKGSNNDGIWNETGVSLKVMVAPPPWKTWWAYALYLLSFSAIIFFLYRYQRVRLVHERKTTEGLRRLNRIKDEILANTSHELRTPLHGIIGLAESLLDGIAGPLTQKAEHHLKIIVSSGLRMIHQVNDILDFSKLNKKEIKLRQRPLDMKILVDIVMEISKPLSRGKDLELINEIPANVPPVYADEDLVQQILYNLMGNAVKFTEKGTVTVWSSLEQDHVVIHVTDTGIGIPSDQFDNLFEPFEQVDGSAERSFGGTGLGLAISKKLVEFQKGSIGVESEVGKGTHFWFSMPMASTKPGTINPSDYISQTRIARLADAPLETDQNKPDGAPAIAPSSSVDAYHILVVDDDPVNLQVLVNQLTLNDFFISEARDGVTAIAMIEKADRDDRPFDLVLLDVMMPKMSGYEVCKHLRKKYSHDTLPVLMLTAKNQIDDLVAGFESGANDYLPKPFSKDELLARIKIQLTLKDLMEKHRLAEKALRISNEELNQTSRYLEMVIDNANVWLNVLDNEGNVVIWNKAAEEISGYTREEVLGHTKIWEWSYPDKRYREEVQAKAMSIIKMDEVIENFETTIQRKDNKTRIIAWHSQNLTDEAGKPIGSIAFGRDITAQKSLEEQLAQSQKMEAVGTLASGIAHDFNNLLQAITGYAQILLIRKKEEDPDFTNLNAIFQAGERAAQLVRQLLLFSRKLEPERIPVDLNREVEKIGKMLERTIPKMVDIELHLGSRLRSVKADPVQVEQVLLNLGSNAADAMPDGGRLLIETENVMLDEDLFKTYPGTEVGNHILIKVTDTGQGMDPETVEHIFDPFFTTKDIGKGTGLGLASVYGIIKNHGGHITCSSEIGKGTVFKIYLPAVEPMDTHESTDIEPESQKGGTETVLIVDDEAHIRDLVSQALDQYGYKILTASSGEEALEIHTLRSKEIDLILMDIGMPGMGGHKCLQEILKKDPSAKVIVASGYSVDGKLKETLEAGASGYIGKPYKIIDLLEKVRTVLDGS